MDGPLIRDPYALQNDRQNLNFVKNEHTDGKKWPEMVVKLAIVIVIRFYSEYSYNLFLPYYPRLILKFQKQHCTALLKFPRVDTLAKQTSVPL